MGAKSSPHKVHVRYCEQLQTEEQANDRHGTGTESLATNIGIRPYMRIFKDYTGKDLGAISAVSVVPL